MSNTSRRGLLVRRAEPPDAPAVARVHVASWRQAYRGLLPQEYLDSLSVETRTMTWAKIFDQSPDATAVTLVAELDDQIVLDTANVLANPALNFLCAVTTVPWPKRTLVS